MLNRLALLVVLTMVAGCGAQGFVSSDMPGVAETLGGAAIAHNTAKTCPHYGAGYGRYSRATTSSDFIRRRVDYAFVCE